MSHRGAVREINEDHYVEDLSSGLWIVADGVGGNGNGQVASRLAVETIESGIKQNKPLLDSISRADDAILNAVENNSELQGMATTVVVCRFDAGHFELSWVGDSRAYLINSDGMMRLSTDHNRAAELQDAGVIDEAEVAQHPGQHELTQALGQMTLESLPRYLGELHDGDTLLLCTDGLSGPLSDQELYDFIQQDQALAEIGDRLLDSVLERGAPDNLTFSLIRFKEDVAETRKRDFRPANSYRLPFDRRPYEENCSKRPYILVLILLVIAALFVLV